MNKMYQDYKRTKEIIEIVCNGDKKDFKSLVMKSLYTIEDIQAAMIFIKTCEDMGVQLLSN